ncbi:hypothetical protein BDV11DRAFT_190200 [Aspergillus similis]
MSLRLPTLASEGGFMLKDPGNPEYDGHGLFPVGGLAWLVDSQDVNKLVPIGAVGEIVFESHELAVGYLNDSEKTAETFIDPPIWAQKRAAAMGCRYLRMGDLGRYERDGSLPIYGRTDSQIKIHGQRVELGEIESRLRGILPSRSEVIVDLVKPIDEPDRPLLTAFCRLGLEGLSHEQVGTSAHTQTIISNARTQLEMALPRHMVPRVFMNVKELPRAYKTDRRKLRNDASRLGYKALLALNQPPDQGPLGTPTSEKEQILARLWAKILRQEVESIGKQSNFLAMGGDSLAAIRLICAARNENFQLTTQTVLCYPILEDMAKLVTAATTDGERAVVPGIMEHDLTLLDKSITQRATDFQEWAAHVGALNGGWIDHFVYDFRGQLDLQRLKESCQSLVDTHSILRAVFELHDGKVYLRIPAKQILPFEIQQVHQDAIERQSQEVYAKDRISLIGSPIVRFTIIKASPQRHRLIMRLSHAQYDGFCAHKFGQHLRFLYFSKPIPRTLPFPSYVKRIQDPRFIHDAEVYWNNYLKGSRVPTLVRRSRCGPPFDKPLNGDFKKFIPEPDLRAYGISIATILKVAWALTIASLSQSFDVVFGDFIAGRQGNIPGIETVVGPCVNFMPVRVQLEPKMTNLQLLKRVQADLILAIPHEPLGFKHTIQKCTDWGQDERFSTIINFVNVENAGFETETWAQDGENNLEVDSFY